VHSQKGMPSRNLEFTDNPQQILLISLLNTYKSSHSIHLLKLLDCMITLKSRTLKTKLLKCLNQFYQFNQKLVLVLESQERKSLHKLPISFNLKLHKCSHFIKFKRNILQVMKSLWIRSWFKKFFDTINCFKLWKKT